MDTLRVAVVGCGGRGKGHISELSSFDDVELVAVCDPVAAARDAAAAEFGVPRSYATVGALLDGESLDAVVVATPADFNAPAALPCLERGVNTLMEKPPGMKVAETIELRDAAARTGAIGMVGWQRRFNPFITRAREMIEERGPVVHLVGEFHKSMTRQTEQGKLSETILQRALMETPIHAIDIVRALAGGEVTEVHSVVRRVFSEKYNDLHGALLLFDNGCVAHIIANYTTDARLERYEIHGRDTSAYLEGVRNGVVQRDGETHELTGDAASASVEQSRYFLDRVREGRPVSLPAANLDEAVKTMELAEAILAGSRGG